MCTVKFKNDIFPSTKHAVPINPAVLLRELFMMTAELKQNLDAASKTGSNVHLNMPAKFKNVLGVKLNMLKMTHCGPEHTL